MWVQKQYLGISIQVPNIVSKYSEEIGQLSNVMLGKHISILFVTSIKSSKYSTFRSHLFNSTPTYCTHTACTLMGHIAPCVNAGQKLMNTRSHQWFSKSVGSFYALKDYKNRKLFDPNQELRKCIYLKLAQLLSRHHFNYILIFYTIYCRLDVPTLVVQIVRREVFKYSFRWKIHNTNFVDSLLINFQQHLG